MSRSVKSLIAIAALGAAMTMPASAQNVPDIFDIFGKRGGNAPFGQGPGQGQVYIENIPVTVSFDSRPDLLPPEATLIVTAIAPPPPNVRRASPLVMGETRLLISRLSSPLQMVIAVPSDMARDIDYAEIHARIVDAQGNITHEMRGDIPQFSGGEPAFIALDAIGEPGRLNGPDGSPASNDQITVSGAVTLSNGPQIMRGATLVVRVTETLLAGGTGGDLVSEERISIDQAQPPFNFSFASLAGQGGDLAVEAHIEDWAARRIYVTPRPVPLTLSSNGTALPVSLRLDGILTGADAVEPDELYIPPPAQIKTITGEAQFDANRGLPAGSRLAVRLKDTRNFEQNLAQDIIPLDGLSGYIDFAISADLNDLADQRSLVLDADITDRNGRVLFRSTRLPSVTSDQVNIRLEPTPGY